MLNVGRIEEGFVLDHIPAGKSMSIYHHLQLDKLDCTVAMIMNAKSNKMGAKDLLKVECDIENINMDVLAVIDHNITVNVIKNGKIVEKKELVLPDVYNIDETLTDFKFVFLVSFKDIKIASLTNLSKIIGKRQLSGASKFYS